MDNGGLTTSLTEINSRINATLLDENRSYLTQAAAASNVYEIEQTTVDTNNERGDGELEVDNMQTEQGTIEFNGNVCTKAPERDRAQPSSPIQDENEKPPPYPGLPTSPMSPQDSPPSYPSLPPPPYTLSPIATRQLSTVCTTHYQLINGQRLNVESRRNNNNRPMPILNEIVCTFNETGVSVTNNIPRMARSRSMLHFTVNKLTDKRTTGVIALENVNGTDLLILDRWNRKLKFFNQHGVSIGGLIFLEDPWDIAKISDDVFAVTVPKLSVIFKINVKGDNLFIACSLATLRKYACLTYYGGREIFICGQVPPFGEPLIDLIGLNGGPALKTFRTDAQTHFSLFSYPRYVKVTQDGIVIVCDWNLKCLLLFCLDGTFVGRYKGTNGYPLREPTGITYDSVQQHINVIDSKYSSTEGTIHKVSLNGRCIEVIRAKKEFRFSRAICCWNDRYAVGSKTGVVSLLSF